MNRLKMGNVFLLFVYLCMIIVLCLFCLSYESSAEITNLGLDQQSKIEFFDDDKGGVVIFESKGGNVRIKDSKNPNESVTFQGTYNFAEKSGKNIYMFMSNENDSDTTVCSYSITKKQISQPVTYALNIKDANDLAILKGGKIFLLSRFKGKNIFSFILGKSKISGSVMRSKVKSIRNTPSGNMVYVQMDDDSGVVKVYDKTFSKQEIGALSEKITCDYQFISDELILDSDGNLLSKKVDSDYDFEKLFQINLESEYIYKSFCKNYLVAACQSGHVKFHDLSNPGGVIDYDCDGEILYLSTYKGRLIIVEKVNNEFLLKDLNIDDITTVPVEKFIPKGTEKNEKFIDKGNNDVVFEDGSNSEQAEEFESDLNREESESSQGVLSDLVETEEVVTPYMDPISENDEFFEEAKFSTDSEENVENVISSNIYDVDLDRHVIKNVSVGTTVSKFSKNVSIKGNDLIFEKKGKSIKSGKVGTGTIVEFKDLSNKIQTFTIVVRGDVTGTGSVSNMDMRAIYNHIFRNKLLEGVYLEAADINGDGDVDTLDLLSVSKFTK